MIYRYYNEEHFRSNLGLEDLLTVYDAQTDEIFKLEAVECFKYMTCRYGVFYKQKQLTDLKLYN